MMRHLSENRDDSTYMSRTATHRRNLELLLLLIVEKYVVGDVNPKHLELLRSVAEDIVSELGANQPTDPS
jgi:hypothetical protein